MGSACFLLDLCFAPCKYYYYGPKMCDLRLAKRAMEIDDNLTKSTNTITEVNLKGIVDGYKREFLGHIYQIMKSESIYIHIRVYARIQMINQ